MIKYLMLRVNSQKQYDKTLADLREVGVNTTLLSGWERLAHNPERIVLGYALCDGFCSDGTIEETELSDAGITLFASRKEFIAAFKAQRSGESK